METFTEPKALVENPHYQDQRQKSLVDLHDGMIDKPIIELINAFNKLPYCFTLQCCYGHFIYSGQNDPHNLEPLPLIDTIPTVEYRIAYIALCIENSDLGRVLFDALKGMADIDPENIQFCCAEWFWERQINSYALQVEPDRFKFEDTAMLNYEEALKIEQIRNKFFVHLRELLNSKYVGLRAKHSESRATGTHLVHQSLARNPTSFIPSHARLPMFFHSLPNRVDTYHYAHNS